MIKAFQILFSEYKLSEVLTSLYREKFYCYFLHWINERINSLIFDDKLREIQERLSLIYYDDKVIEE
jgi:hypothetical protein